MEERQKITERGLSKGKRSFPDSFFLLLLSFCAWVTLGATVFFLCLLNLSLKVCVFLSSSLAKCSVNDEKPDSASSGEHRSCWRLAHTRVPSKTHFQFHFICSQLTCLIVCGGTADLGKPQSPECASVPQRRLFSSCACLERWIQAAPVRLAGFSPLLL